MAVPQQTPRQDAGSVNVSSAVRPHLRLAAAGQHRGRFPRLERLWHRLVHDAIRATVPPTARVFIGLFALGWTVTTIAFWNIKDTEVLVPGLWPFWYLTTSIACWVFFIKPSNHIAYIISGTFATVGVLARAGAVLADMLWDSSHAGSNIYRSPWYPVAEVIGCVLFAASVLFVWHVGFGALHRHRSPRCPRCVPSEHRER